MNRFSAVALAALTLTGVSQAIIIRDDRAVAQYNAIGSDPLYNATGFFGGVGSSFAFASGVAVSATKVITAAHVVDGDNNGIPDFAVSAVGFRTGNNTSTVTGNIASIAIHPSWASSGGDSRHDWAVVTLNTPLSGLNFAQVSFQNPLGATGAMVGYGDQGTGLGGYTGLAGANDRLGAFNVIDALPSSGSFAGTLLTDFDSPAGNANTLSGFGSSATALNLEGSTAPGDSGSGLWAQFGGTWYVVGTLSAGTTDRYGDISIYAPVFNRTDTINFLNSNGVSVVPEPASMTALALGALALIRRRRNSK